MTSLKNIRDTVMEKMSRIHYEFSKNSIPQSPLYHYTNFGGLKGILEGRELLFSDYRYLNDTTEILIANDIIQKTIASFIARSNKKSFFTIFGNIFSNYVREERNSIFTFSFCEMPDYLPAWRWYGDNGGGYSIGFKPSYFHEDLSYPITNCVVSIKVNYSPDEYSLLIEKFLLAAEDAYNNLYLPCNIVERDIDIDLGAILASQLIPLMPGLKDGDYLHEKEHRLYELEFQRKDGLTYPREILNTRKFFTERKRKDISPFTSESQLKIPRLKSERFNHDDICEIWVGPRCDFLRAKEEIIKILQSSGYDIKNIQIIKSSRPYRG